MAFGFCQAHYHRFRNGLDMKKPIRIFDHKSINHHGYVVLFINGKEILEHRYKMQKHIGRKLKTNELVHHKNEDRADNRICNLEVMTRSEHIRLHHKNKPKPKKHDFGKTFITRKDWYNRGSCKSFKINHLHFNFTNGN